MKKIILFLLLFPAAASAAHNFNFEGINKQPEFGSDIDEPLKNAEQHEQTNKAAAHNKETASAMKPKSHTTKHTKKDTHKNSQENEYLKILHPK